MEGTTQGGGVVRRALVLFSLLGLAACNEYDGTDPWPDVYLPESEIDRPKGGDAGAMDSSTGDAAGADASGSDTGVDGSLSDAAADAGDGGSTDAGVMDAASGADAGPDAAPADAGLSDAAPADAAEQG